MLLLTKNSRFVYIILSFETMMVGMIVYNLSQLSEVNFILLLVLSVCSRVIGLTVLVSLIRTYGHEFVKF